MFDNYRYEKLAFVGKKSTDALTAAFAGGGWLHIDDHSKEEEHRESLLHFCTQEAS